jgi:hypothetical protein
MRAERGARPGRPPGARIMLPRRRSGEDRPNVELRGVRGEDDERLKTEPPSSDRPMLERLNADVLRAELAGLAPPSMEPPTTPS